MSSNLLLTSSCFWACSESLEGRGEKGERRGGKGERRGGKGERRGGRGEGRGGTNPISCYPNLYCIQSRQTLGMPSASTRSACQLDMCGGW